MTCVEGRARFEREKLPIANRVAKVRLARLMKYRGLDIRGLDWGSITTQEIARREAELAVPRKREVAKAPCIDALNPGDLDVVLGPMEKNADDRLTWNDTVNGRHDPLDRAPWSGIVPVAGGWYEARPYLGKGLGRRRVYCGRYRTEEEALRAVQRYRDGEVKLRDRSQWLPGSYLTDEEVRAIRRLAAAGEGVRDLARFYRRKVSRINDILEGRIYRCVSEEGCDASDRYLDQFDTAGVDAGSEGATGSVRQDRAGPSTGGPGPAADPPGGQRADLPGLSGPEGRGQVCGSGLHGLARPGRCFLPDVWRLPTPDAGT